MKDIPSTISLFSIENLSSMNVLVVTAGKHQQQQQHQSINSDCGNCRQRRALPMPQCKCPHWQQFKRSFVCHNGRFQLDSFAQVPAAWNRCSPLSNMLNLFACVSCHRICCHAPHALCAPLSLNVSSVVRATLFLYFLFNVLRSFVNLKQVCIVNSSRAVSCSTPLSMPTVCSTG
jgi:hypothetical protein